MSLEPETSGAYASMVAIIGHKNNVKVQAAGNFLFSSGLESEPRVIKWQPNEQNSKTSFFGRVGLEMAKSRHELLRERGTVRFIKSILGSLVGTFLASRQPDKRKKKYAELSLTDKHVRIWVQFMESERDFLFVFEDDIVPINTGLNSKKDMEEFLSRDSGSGVFLNLAEAFTKNQLGLRFEVIEDELEVVRVFPPSCNTTAAYALSRGAVSKMLSLLLFKPQLRQFPADWLLNELLSKCQVRTYFLLRPPFRNGSLLGDSESSVQ